MGEDKQERTQIIMQQGILMVSAVRLAFALQDE
jgi:hypothetical protein